VGIDLEKILNHPMSNSARRFLKDNSTTSKSLFPYELGRIVIPLDKDGNPDLTDNNWHVEYWIWNVDQEKLVRKRESKGINKFATIAQRKKAASLLKKEIDEILIKGAVAYDKNSELDDVNSSIDISKATLLDAFDFACSKKFPELEKTTKGGFTALRKHIEAWFVAEPKNKNVLFKSYSGNTVYKFFDFLSTVKIKDGKKEKLMSKKTYNNYIGYLSSIFNFYVRREIIAHNPVTRVERKKAFSGRHVPYLDHEIVDIKKYIQEIGDHQFLLFIQFIYYGFFRPSEELRYLKIDDIRENTIFIRPEIAKNDTGQHVRIPKPLEKLIQEYNLRKYPRNYYIFSRLGEPGPEHVGGDFFYRRNKKVLEHLSLDGLGKDLYCYKHTGNIRLFLAGADIKTIQQQNRHSTIQQTDIYLKGLGLFRDGTELDIFPEF
jgi:integrase